MAKKVSKTSDKKKSVKAAAQKAAGGMSKTARLELDGKVYVLPVLEGTMGERSVDASGLKAAAGVTVFDPSLANTAMCRSAISYVDGEKGELLLRGYPIEELTERCSFVEVAYLLVHGELPTVAQRAAFSELLNEHSMLHEDMRSFFGNYPEGAHPMAVLSAMVVSLSSFYPAMPLDVTGEGIDITVTRLLSKMRTIAAFSYKKSVGEPYVYPKREYSYCENFLNMMFCSPVSDYKASEEDVRTMNQLLVLHADHEQNASTTTVREVGSTGANLYASVAAGICALWGHLHGGANQAVIEMLEGALRKGLSPKDLIARAKDKRFGMRLMGFGHRIYKAYDPRAKIAKKICRATLSRKSGGQDALMAYAMELEEAALADGYFQERHLYPNVDFYTGLTYRAMGFPKPMLTVLFALGRLPGWIAQWQELRQDPDRKIIRPRQIYQGPRRTTVAAIEERR